MFYLEFYKIILFMKIDNFCINVFNEKKWVLNIEINPI